MKINGKFINNIRNADDTTIVAGSISDLQKLMEKFARLSDNVWIKNEYEKDEILGY